MVIVWAAITADDSSTLLFIDRGVQIIAEYYRENNLEGALKHANISTTDLGNSNRTQHHRTQHIRFTASFPPHNGHQSRRMPIRWTIVPGVFWKVRLALKNTKVSITLRKRFAAKIPQSHFRAAYDGFFDRLKFIIRAKGGQFEKV